MSKLVELEPGDLDVLLTLGNLHLQARRPTAAVDQYQRALLIEPDNYSEADTDQEVPQHAGALEEAIEDLEALIQKYPGIAPYHVQLGDLYVKVGDDERALEQYTTALATQPHFLEATVKLGTQHMRQGRLADAALSFNRAVELNDQLISAFVGLGVAQHDCGHEQESLATFDLAASLEPSTTLLFCESMRLHLRAEQERYPAGDELSDADDEDFEQEEPGYDELIAEAVRRHEAALNNTPNHADLHYRYGLLLRQVGRHADAINAFRQAVTLNPTYAKALVKLAICLKEAGTLDEAIETFQQALRLEPGRMVDVHYELGLLFAQRNQFDLAAEQFEQAGVTSDGDPAFRENLALALQNVGMVDRAAATWQAMSELARDPRRDLLTRREHILRNANGE